MFDIKDPLQNIPRFLDRINLIFYFIVCVPLVLFAIVYLGYEKAGGLKDTVGDNFSIPVHVLIPLFALASLVGSWLYYRQALKTQLPSSGLSEKLRLFYKLLINRYLILIMGTLLVVLGLYLTREQLFSALYMVMLIASSLIRPTPARLIKDFNLSEEDEKALRES